MGVGGSQLKRDFNKCVEEEGVTKEGWQSPEIEPIYMENFKGGGEWGRNMVLK